MKISARNLLWVVMLGLVAVGARGQGWILQGAPEVERTEDGRQVIVVPPLDEDLSVQTLDSRVADQSAAAEGFDVFHDFRLTDRLGKTGITFQHYIVDDVGKHFKPVHYDHANSVSMADVDGDGLYDLYFATQLGSNELWRNLGDGRFENITARAGVGLEDRVSVVGSFGDTDNDGDPDLFVTTVRMGNVFLENDGKGNFTDKTAEAGLGHVGHSSAAVFFDYDLDGLLDLFLTNVGRYTTDSRARGGAYIGYLDAFRKHIDDNFTETSILYRNVGANRFEDVSEATGLVDRGWAGDAAFADLNGDLYPDLYVLNMQGDDSYWENQGGKTFVEKISTYFPKNPWGAMGIAFFDWNNDGLQDLYLTDMHSDMVYLHSREEEKAKNRVDPDEPALQGGRDNIFGNAFWQNRGEGEFEEISDRIGAETYWPWGMSVGDLNADGYRDVFLASSMSYPFKYYFNSLLLNERGRTLRDSEFLLGIEPRPSGETRVPWYELDCSGEDDGHRMCEGVTGEVTVLGSLGTRSSLMMDLEGDGDLDIVTLEFNARPQVLISDLAERKKIRWIEVRLRGTSSNRDGLGATVKVWAGDQVYTQYHDGRSGYLAHSLQPLYFGLGDYGKKRVQKIEVTWPSGIVQTLSRDLVVNSILEIVEEGTPPGS